MNGDQIFSQSQLITFRQHLHAHPELSNEEIETSAYIKSKLEAVHPTHLIYPLGGTGVAAVFDTMKKGMTVLIRGDIDALPIQEVSDRDYRSTRKKVAHLCGHDGHATILLGLASLLKSNMPASGKVILLFQPGEENGTGAKAVLEDPFFNDFDINYVFALHNLPKYDTHEIVIKENEFTAHVNSLIIKLEGMSAHAAEPEHGINPSAAVSEILELEKTFGNPDPESSDFFLITPIYALMGTKDYGISAHHADIRFTLRTWLSADFRVHTSKLLIRIKEIAQKHNLEVNTCWTHEFHANVNNADAVDFIRQSARDLNLKVSNRVIPFKWGEDFGLFTQRYKGAMFGLGAGQDTASLHNPDYDFPDEILETGIKMFHQIIHNVLD